MIKEVIVVEGVHDRQKIESVYPGATCIVTGGSAISEGTIALIKAASLTRGVILFLDPDFPGRQITQKILEAVPHLQVAFLAKRDAIAKNGRKVGVEHAEPEIIRSALSKLFVVNTFVNQNPINTTDLWLRGLSGTAEAEILRKRVCERLGLPPCNGKTFLKWIGMLDIPLSRIDEVLS